MIETQEIFVSSKGRVMQNRHSKRPRTDNCEDFTEDDEDGNALAGLVEEETDDYAYGSNE